MRTKLKNYNKMFTINKKANKFFNPSTPAQKTYAKKWLKRLRRANSIEKTSKELSDYYNNF